MSKFVLPLVVLVICSSGCQEFAEISKIEIINVPIEVRKDDTLVEIVLDGMPKETPFIDMSSGIHLRVGEVVPTNLVLLPLVCNLSNVSEVETWIEADAEIKKVIRGEDLPDKFFLSCSRNLDSRRAHIRCGASNNGLGDLRGVIALILLEKPFSEIILENPSFWIGKESSGQPHIVPIIVSSPIPTGIDLDIITFELKINPLLGFLDVKMGEPFKQIYSIKTIRSFDRIKVTIESILPLSVLMAPSDISTRLSQKFPLINISGNSINVLRDNTAWTIVLPDFNSKKSWRNISWGKIKNE